jgi:adenylate cyclase
MGADETGTIARQKALHGEVIDPAIAEHGGRVFKTTGDGLLVEFPSVVGAVACAVVMQTGLAGREVDRPEDWRIRYRIGINLGDIVIEGDDILGDGVNIAARLEALADAGGICISGDVYRQVRNKLDLEFEDLGERRVKNIAEPVRSYRVALAVTAGTQSPPAPRAEERPALSDKPSIAVLPFNNMSGDPEQAYFADGITEDIITDLSKISGLFVIARNSSFAYKGQSPDLRQVSRELGVRFVLEGSVRKAGGRVRINAQLIDGPSGGHLWAERYDRDLEDIFAVQDEVTLSIVEALKVELTSGEQSRRAGRDKIDPEAYDHLVRARTCLYQFTADSMCESRDALERALELEPDLAPAYAFLSLVLSTDYANGWNQAGPDHPARAMELAQKAIRVDSSEPQGYHALALSYTWLRNLEEAERAAARALELDPNFAGGYIALGKARDYAGAHESAIGLIERGLRLDPQYDLALHFLGRAQFGLRHYEAAEASFKRRLIHKPGSDTSRVFLASLYGHLGRLDEARDLWREVMEINPDYSVAHTRRVLPYRDPAWFDHFEEGLTKAGLPG